MHLTGLRLTNCTRFRGEHELELTAGVYAVVAEHEGDAKHSNGRGKTAFLSSIRWLVEGDRVLDVDSINDLITIGEDEMVMEGQFSNGVFVSRAKHRDDSAKLMVIVPDEQAEGGERTLYQDDAQQELDRIIGLSKSDRLSTCFAEQQEVASLVKMKTTAATSTFESWLELEKLNEAGDHARTWLAAKAKELATAEAEVTQLETLAVPVVIDELERRIKTLQDKADADDAEHDRVLELRRVHNERKSLAELEANIAELEADLKNLPKPAEREHYESDEKYVSAEAARSSFVAERDRLKVLVSGQFDGSCPVSRGFRCPAVTQIEERRTENARALTEAEANLMKATATLDAVKKRREAQRLHDAAERENAVLRKTWSESLAKLRERRKEFTGLEPLVRGTDGEFPPAPDLPAPGARGDIVALTRDLEVRERAVSQLQAARQRVAELKPAVTARRLAARILGPEVALRRVIEGTVATVARDASETLAAADVDLSVEPAWGREVGKPADNCVDCGTPFPASAKFKQCSNCGAGRGQKVKHEFRFRVRSATAGPSGGNRDMAGLALRAAAFRWLKQRRGAEWGIALLDEPLQQLDDANREAAVAGIVRMLSVFDQCFLTAHHRGALDVMPRRILITGVGKDSTLRVVGG